MGAKAAGLQPGDEIVTVAGKEIQDYADLDTAMQRKRAGDVVDVGIYRGSKRMTLSMRLSRRPIPAILTSKLYLGRALKEL